MSPNPNLYNSVKVCKVFKCRKCKKNKWNCEERGRDGGFQRKNFKLLALTETKLKGNEEVSWSGTKWHYKEGVAVLLNDGDRARADMTVAFGAPEENYHGRVMEYCAERGFCLGNTYFEHRIL